MNRILVRLLGALVALGVLATACGSETTTTAEPVPEVTTTTQATEPETAIPTTTVPTTTVPETTVPTTTVPPTTVPTTTVPETTTPTDERRIDADVIVTAALANGEVNSDGDDRIDVSLGDEIAVTVTSDVAEEIHLHGFDILADIVPGEQTTLAFTADTPGKFEVEFEESGAFIVEFIVS